MIEEEPIAPERGELRPAVAPEGVAVVGAGRRSSTSASACVITPLRNDAYHSAQGLMADRGGLTIREGELIAELVRDGEPLVRGGLGAAVALEGVVVGAGWRSATAAAAAALTRSASWCVARAAARRTCSLKRVSSTGSLSRAWAKARLSASVLEMSDTNSSL